MAGFLLGSWPSSTDAASAENMPPREDRRASAIDVERPSADIAIPAVGERPTLPTAGPFFSVETISIEGISDMPEIGLFVDELIEVAEAELARQRNEQELADQGYSDDELLRVARFMDEVRGRIDDSEFTKIALMNDLIALLDDFESRRIDHDDDPSTPPIQTVNVFNLGAVAQRVEDRIRARGLILAQVVVPPQRITNERVRLQVFPGELGDVVVAGNEVVDGAPLERAFADVTGRPVQLDDVDERLRRANDLTGVDITGVFVPGRSPGETRLRLDTVNEKRWTVVERVDNHGAKITGRARGLVTGTVHDLTGAGDDLTLTALRSEGPDEVTLFDLSYRRPLPGLRDFVQANFSRNEFTIGGAQDIIGDTTNYDIGFGTYWRRTRDRNLNQIVFAAYKDAGLTLPGPAGGGLDRTQKITEFGTTLNYDTLLDGWRAVIDGSTTLRLGSITAGRREGAVDATTGEIFDGQAEDFAVLQQRLRLFKLVDFRWPFLDVTTRHSLLINLNGQYTEQLLPAVNRFNIGGADGVRSLVVDDIAVDKGVIANFNLYTTIPDAWDFRLPRIFDQRFSETIRPFVFYDYGYGVTKAQRIDASTQDDTWFEFTGYGVGFEYNLFRDSRGDYDLRGSISWAWPSTSRFGDELFETVIEDEDRIYADLTVTIDQNDWRFWGGRAKR
jgi:hemolysin activation/secretion protein